jgi:Tfp pilus assembly protein PilO
MDVLRNLFGNVTAGIIRLLVTVGILAAVYFFVVRPVLDTTKEVSDQANHSIQQGFKEAHFGDINKTIENVNRQVQREIKKSLRQTPSHSAANKLLRCIQRAHQDVHKIERCNEKYSPS